MITSDRLRRLALELCLDSDSIFNEADKTILLKALDKAQSAYEKYELSLKFDKLAVGIQKLFVKDVPQNILDEATCIIIDLMDQNCKAYSARLDANRVEGYTKETILNMLDTSFESEHNHKIVQLALGVKKYVPEVAKEPRKAFKKGTTEEHYKKLQAFEKGEITAEEFDDEFDTFKEGDE